MNQQEQMRSMNMMPLIFKMSIPAMIGMLVIILYNLADTLFVGQTHNDLMIAAVSISIPVFMLFVGIGSLFGTGSGALISQSLGAGNIEHAKKTAARGIWGGLGVSVIFAVLIVIFIQPIARFLGASDETLAYTVDFMRIMGLSAPFIIGGNILGNIVRSEGSSKESMYGNIIGTVINVILDPILILGCNMGVVGAAIATLIANVVVMIYYIMYFKHNKNTVLSFNPKYFSFDANEMVQIVVTGFPVAIQNLTNSVATLILNQQLLPYGDNYIASMGITLKIMLFTTLIQTGLANGVLPILSFSKGAKLKNRYYECLRLTTIFSVSLGTVLTIISAVFSKQLVAMFSQNTEIINISSHMILIMLASAPVIGILFINIASLQAINKSKIAIVISALRQLVFFIPLLFVMKVVVGINGLVAAQPIADYLSIIISFILSRMIIKKVTW